MSYAQQDRGDVYSRVTAQIIAAIEAGAGSFEMPWHHDGSTTSPLNAASRRAYRGVNVIALWAAAEGYGYPTGVYATYKQWAALGAQVRKGERGHLGVFWKTFDRDNEGGSEGEGSGGEGGSRGRPFMARGFTLFNAAQVDGWEPPFEAPRLPEAERVARADAFYDALGIETRHGGSRAYYRKSEDRIQLPEFRAFKDAVAYYATAFHEAAHATAAPHRLDRDLSGRFGSEAYAAEELVAELAASFLCADLSLAVEPRQENAAYVASWLKVLRADSLAIFTAASKAQAAADWMHARQPAEVETERRAA